MSRPASPESTRATERTPAQLIPTPRPEGRLRWLTRLGPDEAISYDDVVSHLTPRIERALGPRVVANRAVGRGDRPTTVLEPWRQARIRWQRALRTGLNVFAGSPVLMADVRQCYASIDPAVLAGRLLALGAEPQEVASLRDLLERFDGDGVRGLPVGPSPSAILANAVLAVVDERLREATLTHIRWVDDVVVFAGGRRGSVEAFDALRRGLDQVGFEPNPRKTAILTDREQVRERLLRGSSTGGAYAVR